MESSLRFPDLAARPARLTQLNQHVAADRIGVRQRWGDGVDRLFKVPGRVLPGALPDCPGGRLTRIRNGLRGVTEWAGGQVVIGKLDDTGSTGG